MKKLSELNPAALAGVIREENKMAAIAEIKNCVYDGADMIDLHISCLDNTDIQTMEDIIGNSKLPVLALNYNKKYDWSDAGLSEEERVESLIRAVKSGAAGIDMQGYTFHQPSKDSFYGTDNYSFTKNNPKEIVTDDAIISKQIKLIEIIHKMGAEVLLSCHPGITMTAEQVTELALFLEKRCPDILKIVTVANTEQDLAESFRTMLMLKKEVKIKTSYHVCGAAGKLSRIVNPMLGGQIVFCVDRFTPASTMEQLDLKTAAKIIKNIKNII